MKIHPECLKIWLSENDTYRFAIGSYGTGRWPCSVLSGRRLFVEFASNGDLIDLALDGGRGAQDCPANELSACIAANLTKRSKRDRERFAHCLR